MSKWIPKEDETVWRVSDSIASGGSDAIYKTQFWGALFIMALISLKLKRKPKRLEMLSC